jgi:CheY-like chemotaxis protein/CHASE3 domain sensor protein
MKSERFNSLRLVLICAAILILLAVNGWFINYNFRNVTEHEWWVNHTNEVISQIDLTLSSAKDAEAGARGFLITGREEYLEPYHNADTSMHEHMDRIRFLVQDNPIEEENLKNLQTVGEKRLGLLASLIDKFRSNHDKLDANWFHAMEGKAMMDQLRSQSEMMKNHERGLLAERNQVADRSRFLFIWALILTTVLSCGVIAVTFVQIGRNQRKISAAARLKEKDAREKDMIAQVSGMIVGDMSLESAGTRLLEELSHRLGVVAGRLFMVEEGGLQLSASFGVKEKIEARTKRYNIEPLVKAAFQRNEIWEIESIPENYWHISSGLGEAPPDTITFVPVHFQNQTIGIFELAGFRKFNEQQSHVLSLLEETFGVGLNASQTRGHTQYLLEKSQQQSEELQTQQEELKTNNEELEQQARALESQQQALNLKNRELEIAQGELQRRATDLEQSSQYKSDFLARMSHELRTPLNGLLILSTLLIENKEKNLTEQQKQFAKSINSAGNDLLLLINDILDLSKIEARKLSLRPEIFTVESLFLSKHRTFDPQVSAKGLEFVTDLPNGVGNLKLNTDRQRLEQILRNFLSNAIKFTEAGKIILRASYDDRLHRITFTVEDTGIGVAKDKQNTIFDAFEQGDSSVSRKYGGTGLGLTISRELANLLGGDIKVKSEEGQGSAFSLEIPVMLQDVAGAQERVSSAANSEEEVQTQRLGRPAADHVKSEVKKALKGLGGKEKTILIVEDDENFRKSVVETVRSYGFKPIEVGDGEVALAILNEHTPDAILLDIKLPGISGLGILEMIKQLPHLRHIPVHMISALERQHSALRMGALGYLTKPVTIEKVRSALGRIENVLSRKLRRVLLIEDDERQSVAVSELISGNDIEVVSVKSGKSAVDRLKENGFDCIILDLTLPDVSGFDLLSELSVLEISLPPIVIYTGKDLSDEEETYLRRYSESIIIKGARSPERLLDEVNLFLHRVEALLPNEKREMLSHLRSQEKSFEGKTVLLVDDDIRNVFALMSALEAKGLTVRVARNGVEALDALAEHADIDIVFMDIMMPKMDGFEAMKRIRAMKDSPVAQLPIVALTAKAMREDHEKCMEAGASDYLPKPVNLNNLTTVLKVWLAPKGFNA